MNDTKTDLDQTSGATKVTIVVAKEIWFKARTTQTVAADRKLSHF